MYLPGTPNVILRDSNGSGFFDELACAPSEQSGPFEVHSIHVAPMHKQVRRDLYHDSWISNSGTCLDADLDSVDLLQFGEWPQTPPHGGYCVARMFQVMRGGRVSFLKNYITSLAGHTVLWFARGRLVW